MTRPPRRRSPSPGRTYAIACACALTAAALLVLGATAQRGLPGKRYYELTAQFANASNLGTYAEVRIAGRRVGQVTAVTPSAGRADVRLQLDDDVRPLRDGTTATIRLKGLLGAKFVELSPARAGRVLANGGVLPPSRTSSTVELFDVFSALDRRRRAELQITLRGLGGGFLGRGDDLNAALDAFPAALRDLTLTSRAILARTGAAQRLLPALDAAASAFVPVRVDLAQGLNPAARARPGRHHAAAAADRATGAGRRPPDPRAALGAASDRRAVA